MYDYFSQTVVKTRDSHGFPDLIIPAGSGLSHNPTSTFQQLLEAIVRESCRSGCDRCPPCTTPTPTTPTPTPTTLTLTVGDAEYTLSLGVGLVGYVVAGVLSLVLIGFLAAIKADWVTVRTSNPPQWFPGSKRSDRADGPSELAPTAPAASLSISPPPTYATVEETFRTAPTHPPRYASTAISVGGNDTLDSGATWMTRDVSGSSAGATAGSSELETTV